MVISPWSGAAIECRDYAPLSAKMQETEVFLLALTEA
jgi:hypothetical protein